MKKSILASLALAGLAFCGCTQDEVLMSEADEANEKAQIQALAEEYGLEVKFDEAARLTRNTAEPLNLDSVEAEMKAIASLFGEYTCLAGRGDTAIFGKPMSTTTPVKRLTGGFLEGYSGSFQDWVEGPYGDILFIVYFSITPQGKPSVTVDAVSGSIGSLAGVNIKEAKSNGLNAFSFTGEISFYSHAGLLTTGISGYYSGGTGHISLGW